MQFFIEKEVFSKALVEVCRAISNRSLQPVLTGIKCIADEKGITLLGGNGDLFIVKRIPTSDFLKVLKNGSAVLPSKYLQSIVKKMPGMLYFNLNENNILKLSTGEIETKLSVLPQEEYPTLPVFDNWIEIKVNVEEFKRTIAKTSFAASKNETRPVLTGVHFTFTNGHLTAVATNSQRLALQKITASTNGSGSCIIPASTLMDLMRVNTSLDEMKIRIGDAFAFFGMGETNIYTRLLSGRFPNIDPLIPKNAITTVAIPKEAFYMGVDRACMFASEWKDNNVNLHVKEKQILISSGSSAVGQIEERQELAEIVGHSDFKLAINGNYLLDALRTYDRENIKITYFGPMKPVVIQSMNPQTEELHLISPVRV